MRLSERLGLARPEHRAWALYDWANSAMATTVLVAVFPVYFGSVAAAGLQPARATQVFALATTAALVVTAVLAPVLGTLADVLPWKKRLLAAFMALGVVATAGLWFVGPGDWRLGAFLFVLGNVGLNGSFVFYDALLPHVAAEDELDRLSTAGYALGYVGGGILLALNLAWIQAPGLFGLPDGPGRTPAQATLPARLAFLSVAVWWAAFSVPLFLRVPEPPAAALDRPSAEAVGAALRRLGGTFRALRDRPDAGLMLLAFLVYNDGIGTIIRMATVYGTEIGIGQGALIGAILLVQFVGIPCSFLFGAIAGRVGAKRAILGGLVIYTAVSIVGYFMTTAAHFFVLAVLVGLVQGGTQALSRSLFASLVPRRQSGEFFGFFSVTEKFAGIFGPAIFAACIAVVGSSRAAILSVIAFFVVGAALLARVDVERGQRAARASDAVAAGGAHAAAPGPPEAGAG
ncbi:MAG TPA: MFS transporter [Anaeromyxobacteraceae bacterium]|nr:MFS transporter [Anaeromyxobacteraceae bacterium]